jgi:hypothetical protein
MSKTKSNTEYDILSKSGTMWFCVKCRKIAEEHIIIDLKIEKRCKEIMREHCVANFTIPRIINCVCGF